MASCLAHKLGQRWAGAAAQGVVSNFIVHHLLCIFFNYCYYFLPFFSLIKLFLSQPTSFLTLTLPHSAGGGLSEQLDGV